MPPDAERIRRARESLHWPASVVATLLRIKPYAVFAYERGDRSVPAGMVKWLEALATAMDRAMQAHPPPPSPAARLWPRKAQQQRIEERTEEEANSASEAHALDTARLG